MFTENQTLKLDKELHCFAKMLEIEMWLCQLRYLFCQ